MTDFEWIAYPAAVLTTLAFVPQAWLTLRTRDVRGISAVTYAALTAGIALWLAYGLVRADWAMIVSNTITLPLAASILVIKLRAMRSGRQPTRPPTEPG